MTLGVAEPSSSEEDGNFPRTEGRVPELTRYPVHCPGQGSHPSDHRNQLRARWRRRLSLCARTDREATLINWGPQTPGLASSQTQRSRDRGGDRAEMR